MKNYLELNNYLFNLDSIVAVCFKDYITTTGLVAVTTKGTPIYINVDEKEAEIGFYSFCNDGDLIQIDECFALNVRNVNFLNFSIENIKNRLVYCLNIEYNGSVNLPNKFYLEDWGSDDVDVFMNKCKVVLNKNV